MGCSSSRQADVSASGGDVNSSSGGGQADAAASAIGSAVGLTTRVDLSLSCSGLPSLDTFSASDPLAAVFLAGPSGRLTELGRTEVIVNNNNPTFVSLVSVQYSFESQQHLVVRVVDVDSTVRSRADHVDLASQDFIGEMKCQLAQVMGARGCTYTGALVGPKTTSKSSITIRGEEVRNSNALVSMSLEGVSLAKRDLFSSDPYLQISRSRPDGGLIPVYKTEVVFSNLNPRWAPVAVSLQRLANGDADRPLSIECKDYDRSGNHDLIGRCQTSVNDLVARGESGAVLVLADPAKPGKSVGQLRVRAAAVTPRPSFLDFIAGGLQLNFSVAIDFTASNGPPSDPGSLHHFSPDGRRMSPYAAAINAVGGVLEHYDADKLFDVYGFGGVPAGESYAMHSFPLGSSVHGIAGIQEAYRHGVANTRLAGPTLFGQIVAEAAARASSLGTNQFNQEYSCLLIITDGIINDLDATIEHIVNASDLPLSILIVGVGDADFSAMEELDGDHKRLTSAHGKQASRDIVQFVSVNEHMRGKSLADGMAAVTRELLAEIPDQVLQYMTSKAIRPNARPAGLAGGGGAGAGTGVGMSTRSVAVAVPPPPTAPTAVPTAPPPHTGAGFASV